MKEGIVKIGLLVFSVVGCFGVGEAYFQMFDPQGLQSETIHESVYGINNGLKANVRQHWTDRDYDIEITTNSKRLRDSEHPYEKENGVFRILTLGDSFTFGFGVNLQETYAKVSEELLKSQGFATNGLRVETINTGVPGWGTAQELVFYLEEGVKYDPDIITICFVKNDPMDNMNSGLFELQGKTLVRLSPQKGVITKTRELLKLIPGTRILGENSHFYNFVRLRTLHAMYDHINTEHNVETVNMGNRLELPREEGREDQPFGYEEALTIEIFRQFFKVIKDSKRKVIIFDVQGHLDFFPKIQSFFRERVDQKDVFILNTKQFFEEHQRKGESTFLSDGHWNRYGHRLAAEMLANHLSSFFIDSVPEPLVPMEG